MYKRALKADPGHTPSLVNYAVLLQEARGDVDSAEELYRRALKPAVEHGLISLSFISNTKSPTAAARGNSANVTPTVKVGDGGACAGAALSAAATSMTPADAQDQDGFDQGQARRVVKALVNYGNLLFDVRGDVVSAEECLREAVPFSLSVSPSVRLCLLSFLSLPLSAAHLPSLLFFVLLSLHPCLFFSGARALSARAYRDAGLIRFASIRRRMQDRQGLAAAAAKQRV